MRILAASHLLVQVESAVFQERLDHPHEVDEDTGTLLQKVLKMKLSSGKLQFWEWEKTLLVPEHFVSRPYWYITFLHAGNVFRHGGM